MSLKIFHLVFIALSILMCLFVAAWGIGAYLDDPGAGGLALGVACFVLGGILMVYGARVYRKFRELGP